MSESVIDRGRLIELFGDDQAAINEFLTLAAGEMRVLLENLDSAILCSDSARVKSLAHELKGASANIGAGAVSSFSREVELAASNADWTGVSALRDTLMSAFSLLEQTLFDKADKVEKPTRSSFPSHSQRILAIDDSPVSLKIYERLESSIENCAVVAFTSAREALRWARTETVDVVLVDYMMPDLSGLDFLRRFRQLPDKEQIPVLMITSEREREIRHQALEMGAADFLTKPVDLIELISRTRNMLAFRRQQVQLASTADFMAEQVTLAISEIASREREAIFRLARATEFRDTDTGAHIVRMAHYCKAIAEALGIADVEAEELLTAAPMHDIGKVAVSDSILLKPGKLTHDEFEIMKRHTTVGYDILKDSPAKLLQTAALIALTHHEKYDGTGYPQGLRGEKIPIVGRITAVSDVFDALTSARPYKEAWPVDKAIAEMHQLSGSQFDPQLITAFDSALERILTIKDRYRSEAVTAGL
jgi:putative two-component system response regulator